jgi:hypothetical protein
MTEKFGERKNNSSSLGTLSAFYIEARRNSHGISMLISRVIGISCYTAEKVELKTHGGRIIIEGKKLVLSVYENNSVEIKGKIAGVNFGYGKS